MIPAARTTWLLALAWAMAGPRRPRVPLSLVFKDMFHYDPSAKPEDVKGSVPQALLLMNNRAVNAQIKATGNTVLARVLKINPRKTNQADGRPIRIVEGGAVVKEVF